LDWAARQLARASKGENPTDQQSWLAQHNIAVDWKTRLTKTVALAVAIGAGLKAEIARPDRLRLDDPKDLAGPFII
jgi:H+/Cl- antiporter ClcA